MPTSDISSVRGIGVADSVSTSTLVLIFLICSLCCTPKRCSSSTTSRPRSLNLMSAASSRWVPITQSTSPSRRPASTCLAWAAVRNRDSTSTRIGYPANRSANVLPCWLASSVVGASTATCLPSWIALNAARIATSVLPNPTSPHSSRSIGNGRSMSDLMSTIAVRWSGVSTNGKASSISRCHGVSCPKAWPSALTRFWYSTTSSWAISRTADLTRPLALAKSLPPSRCSVGASPPTYWRSVSIWSDGTYSLSPPL